ncbi:MAG TPA: NAD-dependent epimerase/dehydratase family protein, partial [Gammaproteobacteria bacterium]|nr:NAD-dependent epimerase/dehydratase family protein [Gammaproteobacteria bacterium]
FIGKNLVARLRETGRDVAALTRQTTAEQLSDELGNADFVFHLAGVNRPQSDAEFNVGNVDYTRALCAALASKQNTAPLVYASSIQATAENAYGRSKRAAEDVVFEHAKSVESRAYVMRLPNVFGKWCRPNYNSAVATFCHQLARGLPIKINDPNAALRLVYIDDLVERLLALLTASLPSGFVEVAPIYETTVGEVVAILQSFEDGRKTLVTPRVGTGLVRALYSTYVSYLPPERFTYDVPRHSDPRGVFVEMLKTPDCGQFSYFTAGPGITRGEHYHHTKTERFLVIHGTARFQFRHILTGEAHEVTLRGGEGRIVESIPGWTHNVTNVGDDELIVMLWASEIFDRARPDTVPMKVAL